MNQGWSVPLLRDFEAEGNFDSGLFDDNTQEQQIQDYPHYDYAEDQSDSEEERKADIRYRNKISARLHRRRASNRLARLKMEAVNLEQQNSDLQRCVDSLENTNKQLKTSVRKLWSQLHTLFKSRITRKTKLPFYTEQEQSRNDSNYPQTRQKNEENDDQFSRVKLPCISDILSSISEDDSSVIVLPPIKQQLSANINTTLVV